MQHRETHHGRLAAWCVARLQATPNVNAFYVTNESTEDTFGYTDDLQEAIQIAIDVARTGAVGDLVLVESRAGKGVKQFVLTSEGVVDEKDVGQTVRVDLACPGLYPP